jgi:small subunit ribosomal protein S16
MVKIRLQRLGAKKRPFYRIIAIDERARRDGRPLEYLGTYEPGSRNKELKLDVARVDAWISKGAQLSDTVAALTRRARKEPAPVAASDAEAAAPEATAGA